MTGYTIGIHGEFAYYNDWHYVGRSRCSDSPRRTRTSSPASTLVPQYLNYLANHPSTARHLATKLARRFVSDTPVGALIASLANVYLGQTRPR